MFELGAWELSQELVGKRTKCKHAIETTPRPQALIRAICMRISLTQFDCEIFS